MTKEEKQELKKNLPRNWVIQLSERTGYSKAWIGKMLSEDQTHIEIEEAALTLAHEHKDRLLNLERSKAGLI
jgi:transposase-like protein